MKITQNQFNQWLADYLDNYTTEYNSFRLGQAFVNQFLNDKSDDQLFYQPNFLDAVLMIQQKYIK